MSNKKKKNYYNQYNSFNWHQDEMNNNVEIAELAEKVNDNQYYNGTITKKLVEKGEKILANKK